jgi:molybdenum cofactor biosynthesis protein B
MSKSSNQHKSEMPQKINYAVIVSSSSRYRKLKAREPVTDPSGDLIVEFIKSSGHSVVTREILPDDRVMLGKYAGNAIGSKKVDAIIVCGGTGISLTDRDFTSIND